MMPPQEPLYCKDKLVSNCVGMEKTESGAHARFVVKIAMAARRLAAKVEPPLRGERHKQTCMNNVTHVTAYLNPIHPTQRRTVPRTTWLHRKRASIRSASVKAKRQ